MAVLTIARLTLREASRRRLLLAVAILTVLAALLTGWAFYRLLQLPCGNGSTCSASTLKVVAATLLILLMFMFSFVLALGAAFLGAPSIAADVESGTMLAILPRPIRRSDVVLGKWLGLAVLLALYAAISCGLEFVIAKISFNYVPPHPGIAIAFVVFEAIVLLTLTMAGSTRMPAMTWGIVVLVLFGFTWMGGIAGAVGTVFNSKPIQTIGTVSSLILPTDGLWRAAIYNLEPAVLIAAQASSGKAAAGNPFLAYGGPTAAYLIWAALWVAAVLGLAAWSFSRREL
jgi:ABC-type transport system involved in multi-copper enzyme maturation permease subunit